ncbi:MAG: alpha/beta fold hydrolase [Pyrinomonadaceae bacterium]
MTTDKEQRTKEIIHFAHANGFPAKTYNKLFSYLEDDFEISYLERHAHNPKFPVTDGWQRLADELREEIANRYDKPIIGVGHSLGGILHFLVAVEKPEFYKAIILLDAPIISRLSSLGIKFLKLTNRMGNSPLVKVTQFRRAVWKTKAEAFQHFKQKEKFAAFNEDVLRDYIEHGIVEDKNNVNLFFKPSVEAKIYQTLPDYLPKFRGKLKVPAFYIGGTNSREAQLARLSFMQKHFPFTFQFVEGSHLFPLEKPEETAEAIKFLLNKFF